SRDLHSFPTRRSSDLHTWVPMLQAATGCTPGGIKGGGEQWLGAIRDQIPAIQQRNQQLGFNFVAGQRPQPNSKGHIPTTMEWARSEEHTSELQSLAYL